MPILSVAFLTIPDLGPVDSIKLCHEQGFQKVGIRLIPAVEGEPSYPLLTDKNLQGEVTSLLNDLPISISDVEVIRMNEHTKVENYLTLFEVSSKLGVEFITLVNDDSNLDRATQTFSSLAVSAKSFNIGLNLEPMPWTSLTNIADAIKIATVSGTDNTGLLIDVFHFSRCGMTLKQIEDIPSELLKFSQICDAPLKFNPDPMSIRQEARTRRLMPGDGELPIHDILLKLPEDITISVEVPNDQLIVQMSPRERLKLAMEKTLQVLNPH